MTTVGEFNELFAEVSEASRQGGYASGVNAALEVVQHHVDLPTAYRIAKDLLALINGPGETEIEIRRRNDRLGTGSRS